MHLVVTLVSCVKLATVFEQRAIVVKFVAVDTASVGLAFALNYPKLVSAASSAAHYTCYWFAASRRSLGVSKLAPTSILASSLKISEDKRLNQAASLCKALKMPYL